MESTLRSSLATSIILVVKWVTEIKHGHPIFAVMLGELVFCFGLGKKEKMPFAVPMVCRERTDHSDCYFCMTKISGYSSKNKSKISYPVCKSAIMPVLHGSEIPLPILPSSLGDVELITSDDSVSSIVSTNPDFESSDVEEKPPLLINQERLNDIVRIYLWLKLKQNFWDLCSKNGICWNQEL